MEANTPSKINNMVAKILVEMDMQEGLPTKVEIEIGKCKLI